MLVSIPLLVRFKIIQYFRYFQYTPKWIMLVDCLQYVLSHSKTTYVNDCFSYSNIDLPKHLRFSIYTHIRMYSVLMYTLLALKLHDLNQKMYNWIAEGNICYVWIFSFDDSTLKREQQFFPNEFKKWILCAYNFQKEKAELRKNVLRKAAYNFKYEFIIALRYHTYYC